MAKNWWDVEDPKDFFGVQGERNATQQANADRFIKEWEEVSDNSRTSRSTLNGLIDGTYDASLVADNWGSNTSLNGLEQVKSYSDTIGEYGGDFGSYLRQEWDNFNTSQGVDLGGLNTSPTIGTVASDGPSGRASIETPERLSMQSYVDAISSAAQEAGTPLKAVLPDGSMYELNYGQFDDVALGAYKQTQDVDSTLDKVARVTGQIFSSVIQGILTGAVSGALFTGLSKIPKVGKALETLGGVYQNGVLEFFPEAQAALQAGIEQGESITTIMGSYLGFGINSVVTNNIRDQLGLSVEGLDSEDNANILEDAAFILMDALPLDEDAESVAPEDIITEEEVSLEADPDLMGTSTVEETIGDEDFTTAPLPTPEIIVDEVPIDEIPIEITEPEVEFVDPSTDSGGGGGGGEESGGDSSAGAGTTATTGGTEAAGGSDGDPVITRDVEAVDDDPLIVNEGDIVGRQIKETYEAETNPELKEALKEELIAWLEGGAGEPEPIPTTEQPPESTFEPNAGVSGDTAEGEDDFSLVGDLLNIPIDTPESTVPEDVDTSGVTGDTGDAGGAVDGGGAGTDEDGVDTGAGGEAGGGDSTGVADGSGAGTGEGTGEGSGTGEGTGEGEGSGTGGGSGGMLSGGSGSSIGQGYMGGFNYNLPQFVPVAYQPKDYDVELNRIINQSLFKGMI